MERRQYQNEYGTVFAVREKDGVPRLMCLARDAAEWAVSGILAALTGDAKTADDLQTVLDRAAKVKGWKECETEANQPAPSGAAAATTAESAAAAEKAAETSTTSGSGAAASTLTPAKSPSASLSGQGCPADSAPASSGLSAAGAASLAAEPAPPAFDYDGLDRQTVADLHLAEREFTHGKRMAEMGLRRMADGVAIAHEALCGGVVAICDNSKHGHRGEDTFRAWCASIGISKDTAYRLLQVSALYDKSSPKQQKVLEQLAPSLLYAVAKPSAPAELVQGVKDGDITTHRQYQELLKAHQDTLAENQKLRADRIRAINDADRSHELESQATARVKGLEESYRTAHANEESALRRAKAAEARAAEAEKARDGARQVAEAAKLRADKYKAEADALRAQTQAAPATVEARIIDTDEVERLADERAKELAVQRTGDLTSQLGHLRDENEYLRSSLTRPARLASLAESVVRGCAALIQTWLQEAFEATNEEQADSIAVFSRFAYGLDMALRNGEWPSNEEIELERTAEEWGDSCV